MSRTRMGGMVVLAENVRPVRHRNCDEQCSRPRDRMLRERRTDALGKEETDDERRHERRNEAERGPSPEHRAQRGRMDREAEHEQRGGRCKEEPDHAFLRDDLSARSRVADWRRE